MIIIREELFAEGYQPRPVVSEQAPEWLKAF